MSREQILSNIKAAIKKFDEPKKQVDKADIHIKNNGDMVENCITNMQANKTQVLMCKEDELQEKVSEILKTIGSKKLLHYTNLPFEIKNLSDVSLVEYDKSVNEFEGELFECDTSIVKAKLAISNLGVFCVSSDEQPRLMSLLPQNCIVLLKKEDIVNSMNDAYEVIQKSKTPTNIIFISGPSRTADIELIVVLGVHGPQSVYALVY